MKAANWDNTEKSLELCLDPDKLHDILNFPKPQTKCQLQGFFQASSYCWNWIPNFSYGPTLTYLLKKQQTWLYIWEDQDDLAFEALKERLRSPPALGNLSDQLPIFLFVYEKEGNSHEVLIQKHWNYH